MNYKKIFAPDNLIIILSIISIYFFLYITPQGLAAETPGFVIMDLGESVRQLKSKVNKASPGIVLIVTYDNTGTEIGKTSGFFIDSEGKIVTNAAIFQNAYSAEVFSKKSHYTKITVFGRNNDLDLALIQVQADDESPLKFDSEYEIKKQENVLVIGRSYDKKNTVSEGVVEYIHKIGDGPELIQIHTKLPISTYKLSKDGPLLSIDGNVIGLVTNEDLDNKNSDGIIRMRDSQKLLAVSAGTIKSVLNIPFQVENLHPSKSRIWTRWLLKSIKTAAISGFIVLYQMGFKKIMFIFISVVIILSLIQWLFIKLKNSL